MMTSGLLCATDGSAISEKAVVYAVELARSQQQHLAFLTVIAGAEEQHPMVWDEKRLRAGDLPAERELLSALSVATQQDVQHLTCIRVHGRSAAAAIVSYAEKNNYHHIIAGSAGLTGAKRLLLGSVAADIVALAHCPVTIVR